MSWPHKRISCCHTWKLERYINDGDLKVLHDEENLNDNLINGAQLLMRDKAVDGGLRDMLEVAGMCSQVAP